MAQERPIEAFYKIVSPPSGFRKGCSSRERGTRWVSLQGTYSCQPECENAENEKCEPGIPCVGALRISEPRFRIRVPEAVAGGCL